MQIPLQICRYWYGRTYVHLYILQRLESEMVRYGSCISESLGFGISDLHSVVLL
jgi:hypothetical protein